MSAYIVPRAHIHALLRVGLDGPADARPRSFAMRSFYWTADTEQGKRPRSLSYETVDAVGQMLTDAVVRSVAYRYPDAGDDLPGTYVEQPVGESITDDGMIAVAARVGDWNEPYEYPMFRTARHLTAVEALKALDGYEYQACEPEDWEESEAHAFCAALRTVLIGLLPGYEEADTWEVTA